VKGKARCLYHDDHDPSLDISVGHSRDIIAYCQVCGPVFDRLVADGKLRGQPSSTPKPQSLDMSEGERDFMRLRDAMKILRAAARSGDQPSAYLAARGINKCPSGAGIVPISEARRLLSGVPEREGKRVLPKNAPVMTFSIIGKGGLQGAHTTALTPDGTAKLNATARRIHGLKKGGYIPLCELHDDKPLLVGE
jgi:hypothetical protein